MTTKPPSTRLVRMLLAPGIAIVFSGLGVHFAHASPGNDDWWPEIVVMDPVTVTGSDQPDPPDIDWPSFPPIDPWLTEPEWPGDGGSGGGGGDGNNPPPPPDDCATDGSASGTAGTNPFHVYDGNASRMIVDLEVPGATRADSLYWMRHHNTVRRGEKIYFGTGGGWRSNWQYDLAYIPTGDELDEPILYFVYPNGMRRVFRRQPGGAWAPEARFDETVAAAGDGYEITTPDNTKLLFEPMAETNHKGHVTYLLKRRTTAAGRVTTLDYNAEGLVAQITDDDGKRLALTYQTTPLPAPKWRALGEIYDAPQPGQWIEIALDEEMSRLPWQRIRLTRRKGRPLAVAEIQIFAPGSDTPLRGIPVGSGDNPEYAFDGNPGTAYESTLPKMYNLIALDRGADAGATPVSRIRILAAPGREELLEGVGIKGMLLRPAGSVQQPQLAQVTADDGRFVRYEYDVLVNAFGDLNHPSLVRAVYSDGTRASYGYEYIVQTKEPLLVEADDPRYSGRAKRIQYTYRQGGAHGMVHEERNPATGGVYASLELDPADPDARIVHYTDMKSLRYRVPASANGRVTEYTDSLGRTTRLDYADNGRGRLKAETDTLGRRTDYARDHKGRVTRLKRSDGRERIFERDNQGRITRVADEKGRFASYERDHAGKITGRKTGLKSGQGRAKPERRIEITRDAAGRVTRYRSADGTAREYVRDMRGRIVAHTGKHGEKIQVSRDARGRRTAMTDSDGRVVRFGYDRHGWLDRFADAEGKTTVFERDERGNITRRVNPDGSARLYSYDQYGRKTAETDELGRAASWAYDELSRLTRHVDFAGGVTLYDYTETPGGCGSCSLVSRPSRVTHPDGRVDEFLYDTEGRLLMRSLAAGTAESATTLYAYDDADHLIRQANPDGGITRHAYDDQGRRVRTTGPLGHVTTWTYDDDGRLLEDADPSGRVTRRTYDEDGNLLSQTAPGGGVTAHAYDDNNRRVRTTDALGNTTRWSYDAAGELVSQTDAAGAATRHAYDKKGRRIKTTLPDGTARTWTYDALDRVVRSTNPGGLVTVSEYDASGRLAAVTASAGKRDTAVTRHTYDAAGRRASVTDALGRTTRYAYDARDQVAETLAPDGARTRKEYDSGGRVAADIDALGHATRYDYTALGDMASLTDANGNTYRFEYDAMRRKTAMIYPDASRETWAYDLGGRLVGHTTRAGQTRTIAYNADGRPVAETWSPAGCAPDVRYTYDDATGRLLAIDNGRALLTYTYDKLGRVATETTDLRALVPGMAPHTIAYLYDAAGRKAGLVYPDGMKVTYRYDAQGRMTEVGQDGGTPQSKIENRKSKIPLAAYAYDSCGRRSKLARDNGVITSYSYDIAGQLLAIDHRNKQNRLLAKAHYAYDLMGRRVSMTREDDLADHYRYDATSQLIAVDYGVPTGSAGILPAGSRGTGFQPVDRSAGIPARDIADRNVRAPETGTSDSHVNPTARTETFTYDPLGNRIEHTDTTPGLSALVERYETNNLNQYTRIDYARPAVHYSLLKYDANGNLTDDGTQRYRYDAQNRLIEVESPTVRAEFAYDAKNRCVMRRYYKPDNTGNWALDATDSLVLTYDMTWNLLVDRNLAGKQTAAYVHGNLVNEILAAVGGSSSRYPLADVLGSAMAISDGKGSKVASNRVDVFGLPQASSFDYRFLYTGREWLDDVGLNDHRYRYYNPKLSRWLSMDPIRQQGGFDLYSYVLNSPINLVDPDGLRWVDVYIWEPRVTIIPPSVSVGHVMLTEHNSDGVIMSQFPHAPGASGCKVGPNTMYDFASTYQEEGRPPSSVFSVWFPY
ncbi:RHS repeat-associated core domain-containing protein, partial [Termitidicoccus mucosus]